MEPGSIQSSYLHITIKAVLFGTQAADLTRCTPASQLNIRDLLQAIPKDDWNNPQILHAAKKIYGNASKLSLILRHPFISFYDEKSREFKNLTQNKEPGLYATKTFVHYATSPEACVDILNQKYPELDQLTIVESDGIRRGSGKSGLFHNQNKSTGFDSLKSPQP